MGCGLRQHMGVTHQRRRIYQVVSNKQPRPKQCEVREMANRLDYLRTYLESERNRLREDLQIKTSEQPGEKGNAFGKRGEASLGSSDFERGRALAQRVREQLAEVEHALEKFEKGTYGQCDHCGKNIPFERLEAIPQTSVCVECKAKHKGAM